MKIPFAKQAYESRSKPLMAQRCVNFYMEPAPEGAISDFALFGTPGLVLFANLGSDPIYGLHVMGSKLYAVSGNNVYEIDSSSASTNLGNIGSVADVVIMDDNETDVTIVKEDGAAYLAHSGSLVQITDGDYNSSSSVTVLDSFNIFTNIDSAFFQISVLNDATAYDALDIAKVEGISGNLVRAINFRGECWMFKQFSLEVYYNSGAGDFPFIPIGSASMQRGCAAKRSVAVDSDHIAWLGDDRVVYIAENYNPERISTFGIEQEIESYSTISDAEGFIYTQGGHKFYVLTFPTELVTWVYDITVSTPEQRIWHQRQSFGKGRWRASSFAFFNGMNLVGDFETGKIYRLDLNTYSENGDTLQALATCPPIFSDGKRLTHDRIQIQFDTGVGLVSGQGSDPQCMMRYSDDGGYNWSNERTKSIGMIGKYKDRVVFRKNGQARERIYEISITDPVKRNITRADADIRVGSV